MNTNLLGPIKCCRAVTKPMLRDGGEPSVTPAAARRAILWPCGLQNCQPTSVRPPPVTGVMQALL